MTNKKTSRGFERPRQPMPDFVRDALDDRGVTDAYRDRPPYQRNDYLWWINDAKREATKKKRLEQMLDELEQGDVYMNMRWAPGGKASGSGEDDSIDE